MIRHGTNIPEETLKKHKTIYDYEQQIKTKPLPHNQVIVNLKPSTLLTNCCSYIEQNDINLDEISYDNLSAMMIKDGYSFIQISNNQDERCWRELLIRYSSIEPDLQDIQTKNSSIIQTIITHLQIYLKRSLHDKHFIWSNEIQGLISDYIPLK